jgi:hypothetical protein
MRKLVALFHITSAAAAHKVLPRGFPAVTLRYNVIDSQILCSGTTILAHIVITGKHRSPGEFQLWQGTFDMASQLYHGRHDNPSWQQYGFDLAIGVQDIGLAKVQKHDGAPHIADIKRFVVAV